MLYSLFRSLAFNLDPETVHDLSINSFNKMPQLAKLFNGATPGEKYAINDGHMKWKFPIGLAAGFDKNARAIEFMQELGFGALEIGTITPKAQIGNPRPRIQRLKKENSLLNAMGFPNMGSDEILNNLKKSHKNSDIIIGSNLGKNKDTPDHKAPEDYASLYETFAPHSDYLVINISSPNTPGLRALQSRDGFKAICEAIDEKRKVQKKPLYLKIAPELADSDLKDLIDICKEYELSGIIATNTSIQHNYGKGGLSGDIIRKESRATRERVLKALKETPELSCIGVGGINSFQDLKEFWALGGSFAQIYTSFIYHGPQLLTQIQSELDKELAKYQVKNLREYIQMLQSNGAS
tara:strand:- start:3149 stop:4204 length:1056 start_codon:yes stop_codon:yes gene_type:complete